MQPTLHGREQEFALECLHSGDAPPRLLFPAHIDSAGFRLSAVIGDGMLLGRSVQDVALVPTALRGSGWCWKDGDTAEQRSQQRLQGPNPSLEAPNPILGASNPILGAPSRLGSLSRTEHHECSHGAAISLRGISPGFGLCAAI